MLVLCIGLIGMLLITFSQFTDTDTQSGDTADDRVEYNEQAIRQELEKMIECINGVGKVRVMITYDTTRETVYAANSDIDSQDNETRSQTEHIIIDANDGETGLTVKVIYPKVRGVAVVCSGGADPVIKGQIVDIVSALFDISSKNITVAEMAK